MINQALRCLRSIVGYMAAEFEAGTPVWLNEPNSLGKRFETFNYDSLIDYKDQYVIIPMEKAAFKEFLRDMHITAKQLVDEIEFFYAWREGLLAEDVLEKAEYRI